jgi:hypothetical protein
MRKLGMEVVEVLACTLDKPGISVCSFLLLEIVPEDDIQVV